VSTDLGDLSFLTKMPVPTPRVRLRCFFLFQKNGRLFGNGRLWLSLPFSGNIRYLGQSLERLYWSWFQDDSSLTISKKEFV